MRRRWGKAAGTRWVRRGLVLLTGAAMLLAFTPVIRAVAASSDDEFNRWVGWANILALPPGVIGLGLTVLGWALASKAILAGELDREADLLAERMLTAYVDGLKQMIDGDVEEAIRLSLVSDEPVPRWQNSPLIVFGDDRSRDAGDISTVHLYFRALRRPRLTVLGPAGSGKTVLITALAIRCLKSRRGIDGDRRLPYRLPAASYDPYAGALSDWIAARLAEEFHVPPPTARELVRTGRVLPMLDGLDELDPAAAGAPRLRMAVERIDAYAADEVRGIVLTTQPEPYESCPGHVGGETLIRVMPLDDGAVDAYLRGRFARAEAVRDEWRRVLRALDGERKSMLRTPLWLSIAVRAFTASPREMAAATAAGFRAVLVDGLLRIVCRGSRYGEDEAGRWLGTLAAHLERQRETGRPGSDIALDRLWTISGERLPRLVHAALSCAIIVPVAWVLIAPLTGDPNGLVAAAAIVVAGGSVVAGTLSAATPLRYLRDPVSAVHRVPRRIVLSAAILVVLFVALLWFAGRPALAFAAVTILCMAVVSALFTGVDETVTVSVRGAMRTEVVVGVLVTVLPILVTSGGGAAVLGLVLRFDLAYREVKAVIAFGLLIGVLSGIWFTRTTVRYALSLGIQAARGRLPLRLAAFLDWAVPAGLMRGSGRAYQFRHDELRQHFLAVGKAADAERAETVRTRAWSRGSLSTAAGVSVGVLTGVIASAGLNAVLSVGAPVQSFSPADPPVRFVVSENDTCDLDGTQAQRWKVPGHPTWPGHPQGLDFHEWLDRNGAVDKGVTRLRLVFGGRVPQAAVITGIRPRVVARNKPMRGATVGCTGFVTAAAWTDLADAFRRVPAPRGETPVVGLVADLDQAHPAFGAPGGATPWAAVPVRDMEHVAVELQVRTERCDCSWVVDVSWTSAGQSGSSTITDQDGRPFRTTA
ncbi:hypothetical protein JOL79_10465 [Microbispora sp. RL4-1S]|uniref:NACHT domain-containing protein n=1 Tax=Microbispora oryzae TaxID=2806554 RepID=A0A941AJI2_9ACTN|nr:hypothetical protein [Microbispora oryzae]MBP2704233.1 hypothetical protein [Microbispora oryzae]